MRILYEMLQARLSLYQWRFLIPTFRWIVKSSLHLMNNVIAVDTDIIGIGGSVEDKIIWLHRLYGELCYHTSDLFWIDWRRTKWKCDRMSWINSKTVSTAYA